ncbi:MAG: 30S ribosomal protein S3 [Candidatus Aenigmarchaeota archaeon]|nr:30S ribosomal protein S3 [Candidatus Aenigmarchaeota archaeon]
MKEKIFIKNGVLEEEIYDYLVARLKDVNFEDVQVQHLPTSLRVLIYTTQPGMIIGEGGQTISLLTDEIRRKFGIENAQIDIQRIANDVLAPRIIAHNIARGLENRKNYRKLAEFHMNRIMRNDNVLGAEIIFQGKFSGAKTHKDKFMRGYMKKSGDMADKYVRKGYAMALPKMGSIGVKVNIFMKPEAVEMRK